MGSMVRGALVAASVGVTLAGLQLAVGCAATGHAGTAPQPTEGATAESGTEAQGEQAPRETPDPMTAHYDAALATQVRDAWSEEQERRVRATEFAGFSLVEVHCRQTFCRIVLTPTGPLDGGDAVGVIGSSIDGGTFAVIMGPRVVRAYVARKGLQLPAVDGGVGVVTPTNRRN